MTKYYSPLQKGFFDSAIHGENIPSDCIELTDAKYRELIKKQSEGEVISVQSGNVVTIDPPPPEPKTKFTSLEYLDRFTQAEQESIVTATGQNVQLKLFYDRLLAATFIDLDDPRTEAGVDALISAGLIDASRKAQLLQPE
ncbi:hypothetical protein [uncultured Methylophaga sp.]|uniref:hypothetical protein n=1 Tax=uncultured Methylophaga sp. TaxID=285271 RepID=UPI0030FC1336